MRNPLDDLKPKYSIVYVNLYWQHRGGYAATGQTVVTANDLKEVKVKVKQIVENDSDIITVIDLSTGLAIEV